MVFGDGDGRDAADVLLEDGQEVFGLGGGQEFLEDHADEQDEEVARLSYVLSLDPRVFHIQVHDPEHGR